MTSHSTSAPAGAAIRALALAAALACGAGASLAADATLKITSFSVSAADFSGTFAYAVNPYQVYNMSALEAGGLYGTSTDDYSADNWNLGLNRHAQTTSTSAVGNTVQFTDGLTGLTTAGYNLAAKATSAWYPGSALPNSADASAVQSASFLLLDGSGSAAAGTLTFDIYYDMSVTGQLGSLLTYGQTVLNVLASTDAGAGTSFADGLLSSSLAGSTGTRSGHFSWTATLAAGQAAYYTLSSSAIAVAAVPEPGTYALMGLGLVGVMGLARRSRRTTA